MTARRSSFPTSPRASPCTCATASACRSSPACRFAVDAGECVVLGGPSGAGKSSILKMVYGNYAVDAGADHRRCITASWSISPRASPRTVLALRRDTIGYVSQFLRTVPRVTALDVVAEPLVARGVDRDEARGDGARAAGAAQPAGAALVAAAGDLLRRRAAAGQHRPRLHHRRIRCCCSTSRPPRSMPTNRAVVVEHDRREEAARHRAARHLPRRGRARRGRRPHHRRHRLRRQEGRRMSRSCPKRRSSTRRREVDDLDARPLHRGRRRAAASATRRSATIPTVSRTAQIAVRDDRQVLQHRGHVRIYATNHPMWRPSLHHFTYRSPRYYWDDAEHDADFFDWRRGERASPSATTPGSATARSIMPGVTVGNGAIVGSGAVVTKDVAALRDRRRRAGASRSASASTDDDRRALRRRSPGGTGTTRKLRAALDDFRALDGRGVSRKVRVAA